MTKVSTSYFLLGAMAAMTALTAAGSARAQQEPGARAGTAYVPSTHTAGCGGILCDGNSPERAVGAPPPPPCQGLICGLSPYSMQRPLTASEAQRAQEERSRAAVPAASPADTPSPKTRKHRSKTKAAKSKGARDKSVAVRTPDPGAASPQPQ